MITKLTCSRERTKAKIGGYVPCEQSKRGYVLGAKNANRQKCGYVPDHFFVNRRGYDLVVSLTRATSRLSVY